MSDSIATQTIQAACLSALSNLIAQFFSAYQSKTPFLLEISSFIRYVLYGVLNTPLNCYWQEYLERAYPAQDAPASSKKTDQQIQKSTGFRNLVIKFGLDQTVGAAANILFFIVVQGALNGATLSAIGQSVVKDSLGIYVSGLMIWPLVSLISFAVLPVERRVLFGCSAGVAWGVYLSLVAMDGNVEKI